MSPLKPIRSSSAPNDNNNNYGDDDDDDDDTPADGRQHDAIMFQWCVFARQTDISFDSVGPAEQRG
jgi:hypothetical protein